MLKEMRKGRFKPIAAKKVWNRCIHVGIIKSQNLQFHND
jgi:hypothetical protein